MSLDLSRKPALASAWLLAFAASTSAGESAHVHGKAYATVVAMGDVVEIEFTSAMGNLAGFEHSPRDHQQSAQLIQALRQVQSHAPSVSDSKCVPQTVSITIPELCALTANQDQVACDDLSYTESESEQNHHNHADQHDHTLAHEEDGAHDHGDHDDVSTMNHLNVVAQFTYTCGGGLPHPLPIDMPFITQFPGLETVEVSILTETGAHKRELNPLNTFFALD